MYPGKTMFVLDRRLTTTAVLGLVVTSVAFGQTIVSRQTDMSWTSLYGGGPTSFDPSDSLSKSIVVASDSSQLAFSDSQSGDFPLGWTASVAINMLQTHSISGPLNSFQSISASMVNTNSTTATGIGQAGIPGQSEQYIGFTIESAINYRFEGSVFYPNGGAFRRSIIELQGNFPWGWSNIFSTALPDIGSDGSFSFVGNLAPGQYRIRNYAELQGAANNSFTANNEYTFTNLDAVPEPFSMVILGGGALIALGRRRRYEK